MNSLSYALKKLLLPTLLLHLATPPILKGQAISPLDTLLFITFPSDSDSVAVSIMRFGALSLDTAATVTVQGESRKIYPSGAVTGMVSLEPGTGGDRWDEHVPAGGRQPEAAGGSGVPGHGGPPEDIEGVARH